MNREKNPKSGQALKSKRKPFCLLLTFALLFSCLFPGPVAAAGAAAEENPDAAVNHGEVLPVSADIAEKIAEDMETEESPEASVSQTLPEDPADSEPDRQNISTLRGASDLHAGTFGTLHWSLNDEGVLRITGSGPIPDCTLDSPAPWGAYYSEIVSVELGSGITRIGNYAFYPNHSMQVSNVEIPDTVTEIGEGAFYKASFGYGTTIEAVITIPSSVTSIGNQAFYESFFRRLIIQNGVRSIGDSAFARVDRIYSVSIPASVSTIGNNCFAGIGRRMLYDVLPTFTVDRENQYYDSRDNCNALIETATNTLIQGCCSSIIPESVTKIGEKAFYNCLDGETLTIPSTVTEIDNNAFSGCLRIGSSSFTEAAGLKTVGERAFENCTNIYGNVTIPNAVETIGYRSFAGCKNITELRLSKGMSEIPNGAFYDCRGLKILYMPDSILKICQEAFFNCSKLTDVYYGGIEEQWELIENLNNYWISNAEIHCSGPEGTSGAIDGHFYKVIEQEMSWEDAKLYCEKQGGHLVNISTKKENGFVKILFRNAGCRKAWLGFHKDAGSEWIWEGGVISLYKNWGSDEPKIGEKYAALINEDYGKVWHSSASEVACFICEWDFEMPTGVYGHYMGHTYKVIEDAMTWEDADEFCSESGGHLVSLTSAGEDCFVGKLFQNSGLDRTRIGLHRDSFIGLPIWNGELFNNSDYRNFDETETEPTEYPWYSVLSKDDDEWHYLTTDTAIPFICEWNFDMPETIPAFPDDICKSSEQYSHDLALLSARFSQEAENINDEDAAIRQMHFRQGFKRDSIKTFNYGEGEIYSFSIAGMELDQDELILITARGTKDAAEAIDDKFPGTDENTIFRPATVYGNAFHFEELIWNELKEYLENYTPEQKSKMRILINGHSLGGAGVNLLAAKMDILLDQADPSAEGYSVVKGLSKDRIHAYTFGAIDSITEKNVSEGFSNIHNIYNYYDSFGPHGHGAFVRAFEISKPKGRTGLGRYGSNLYFAKDFLKDDRENGINPNEIVWNHQTEQYIRALEENYEYSHSLDGHRDVGVLCPVDVEVLKNGKTVGLIRNNVVDEGVTSIPMLVVGDQKFAAIPDTEDYEIRLRATGSEPMTYYAGVLSDNGPERKVFDEVSLEPGKTFLSEAGKSIEPPETRLFSIDEDGDIMTEVQTDGSETNVGIPASGISLDRKTLEVEVGSSEKLTAEVLPADARKKKVVWQSSDPSKAEVDQNGEVKGISPGKAVITATSVDGKFTDTCEVTVTPYSYGVKNPVRKRVENLEIIYSSSVVFDGKAHINTGSPKKGKKVSKDVDVVIFDTETGQLLPEESWTPVFKKNKNAGTASFKVKLKGKKKKDLKKAFKSQKFEFSILPLKVSGAEVTFKEIKNGKVKKLKVNGLSVPKKFYKLNGDVIEFSGNYSGSYIISVGT